MPYLVRAYDPGQLRAFALWIVIAGSVDAAIEAVRQRMPEAAEIGVLTERVSPETVDRLGLAEGQAWRI